MAEVIVVLGARVLPDGSLGAALERRVQRAAQAFHQGLAPRLVCSGGKRWNGHVEALRMRERLMALQVPAPAILVEVRSFSTCQNAFYSARLLRGHGLSRAVLVSCPWHLRRALADFRHCGLHATALAADCPPASLLEKSWRLGRESFCHVLDSVRLRTGWML